MKTKKLYLATMFAAGALLVSAKDNMVWPRPVVLPKPASTSGVKEPVVSLGGTWRVNLVPPAEFWRNSVDPATWTTAVVPGDLRSQGIVTIGGNEYAYKTKIKVPADFTGKRVFLRFEGVTGLVRVWVNGSYIREHFGGFTAWNCDITDQVSAGQEVLLTLGVTETSEGITSFNTGGILRDIKLIAVPQDHVTRFNIETDFDAAYRNATLRVRAAIAFHQGQSVRLTLHLKDPQGKTIPLKPSNLEFTLQTPEQVLEIPIATPAKWDAEHPNLYTLEGTLLAGDTVLETVSRKIGFREIELVGQRLLVNGKEVKLRGANHHDTFGPTARSVTPEMTEQDVKIFRDGNFNFLRTSHYPPMEEFLEACDRYGMYVGDEASVAFANEAAGKPELKPLFLNQFAEQIERDRSHPSVLMWSLANESSWGINMQAEADYARAEDKSRPTIFSFADRAPGGKDAPYDIFSMHYASYSRDPSGAGRHGPGDKELDGLSRRQHIPQPVLHDEFAHIPSHDRDEVRRDPGVRNFYGESIKRFWEGIFPAEGALGGAIWAGIDEDEFEWGLLDYWRREKPEFWLAKKAYSPVRIDDELLPNPGSGKPLHIALKNWFDHTNLKELRIQWSAGRESGVLPGPDVEPHSNGALRLPSRDWHDGDVVNLKIYRLGDLLVDEYNLPINPPAHVLPDPQGPTPNVAEEQDKLVVSGTDFTLVFSKQTGLITRGEYKGTVVIESGPYLQLAGGSKLPEWQLKRIAIKSEWDEAVVSLSGKYGATEVAFELRIDGHGLINTKYRLDAVPALDREIVKGGSFYRDVGGHWEVGVAFILNAEVDRLAWCRQGLWSAYPSDHIGRNKGVADREGKGADGRFHQKPEWSWAEDERNFIDFGRYDVGGRGTNDFRSMKHDIYSASALIRGTTRGLTAESNGSAAVRLEVLENPRTIVADLKDPRLTLTGAWSQAESGFRTAQPGDTVELAFTGPTISLVGPRDLSGGLADIYVDGKLELAGLSWWTAPTRPDQIRRDLSREVLFSKEGMNDGPHTIRIVARGKDDDSQAGFVTIGAFKIVDTQTRGAIRFIVNNLWNYPQVSWGNYAKDPIFVGVGYTNLVRLRLGEVVEGGQWQP